MLDLHPGLFRILNVVEATEGQSQQAIGEAIEVPASRMVALVDELERQGLVERHPDPDRRVRVLHLTAKGRRLLERGRKIAAEHEADLTKDMSAGDRKRLIALLRELAANQGIQPGVHPGLSEPRNSD